MWRSSMGLSVAKPANPQVERIARNLRSFREEFGLSQPKMAAVVGVPPDTWIKWEAGTRTPGGEMLFRIADAIDRSVDDIGAEKPTPMPNRKPPALALSVLDNAIGADLLAEASRFLRDVNRKHRQRLVATPSVASSSPPTEERPPEGSQPRSARQERGAAKRLELALKTGEIAPADHTTRAALRPQRKKKSR